MAHATVVTSETELVAAIDSSQTEIALGDDITITLNSDLPEILTGTTINGNGSTLNGNGNTCIDNSGGHELTLKNIDITGCDNSGGDGGAVTSTGGTVTVKNSTISGNLANRGGGISVVDGDLTIKDSIISDNTAEAIDETDEPALGGGIFFLNETSDTPIKLKVIESDITGNTASDERAPNDQEGAAGGGLAAGSVFYDDLNGSATQRPVRVTIQDSNISENKTDSETSAGGGIAIETDDAESFIEIRSTLIKNNKALSDLGLEDFGASDDLPSLGGGLAVVGEAFELSDLRIEGNEADVGGGAFLASDGCDQASNGLCGRIVDSSISGNTALLGGGIVFKYTEMVNSTISNNQAYYYAGGGIGVGSVINETVISSNTAQFTGGIGAKYNSVIINSTISGNTAGGDVGGISANKYTQVLNSTISGNTAGGDVGGIYADDSQIINSTISGNTAEGNGGGIYANDSQIINSTISGNVALGNVGGATLYGSMMALSTVADNTAQTVGGVQVGLYGSAPESVLLEGVIIAGNNASTHPDLKLVDSPADLESLIRYSVIGVAPDGDTLSETVLVDVDPMLGPLADNGGETFTHAPSLGSPARFLVPANKCAAISDTDQRGESRPSETACTAGSVEVQGSVPDPVPVPIMSALAVMLSATGMALFGWLGLRRRPRF